MAESTRFGGASDAGSLPEAFEAKVRATWEAGYRAAMRDQTPGAGGLFTTSDLAWEAHGDDGTRWAP